MKVHVLFLILLLACMYPSLAQGTYENCCLRYDKEVKKQIKRRTVSFRIQVMDGGCNIPAIVFRTKKSKTYCGNPKHQWVQDLMKITIQENTSY
ncbi:C-C motif chemokine 25b [Brachyhypopomus gauderio]|uniref:C-C motif chemokine 25b n=1 Tax=Brachyhypopomus gauderio TaxID=698409 RepID=UPI004041E4D6